MNIFISAVVYGFTSLVFANPYDSVYQSRMNQSNPMTIDLGYGVYTGYYDFHMSMRIWKGIRYASPPLGRLRFLAPEVPMNRSSPSFAWTNPPSCYQASNPSATLPSLMNPTNISSSTTASEDCLYLNVYSPPNAYHLPVFVWIHGGGYQTGSAASFDPSTLMATNDNAFVSMVLQYRLGAFGFLSSEEIKQKGSLNTGLLDQQLALKWVQKYVALFGGDANNVTIAGESAGAGSVINHVIAYGGALSSSLFKNAITSSPFLPQYSNYDADEVQQIYTQFATVAGCGEQPNVLECLQSTTTPSLEIANQAVASSTLAGTFAWKVVVDGSMIQQRPSEALNGRINGCNIFTS